MAGKQQNNRGDFQPESQWTEEAAATILTIKLPGFTKEQLKITFDESSRNLRVEGEEGRRFSRDFKIPEKCKLNEMKAKFDQNTKILTITMPKKNPSPPQKPTSTEAIATQLPSPSPPSPAWRDPLGHIKSPPLPPTPTPQDAYRLPTPTKPKPTTKTSTTNSNTIAKQNVPDAPAPAATYQLPPPPPPPPSTSPNSKKGVPDQHTPTTNPRIITPPDTENKSTTNWDETMSRGASPRISPLPPPTSPSEAAAASLLEKMGPVTKRAVLGGLDEERRLLVNAGVAVLVIAALGVYISYKFGSSGKTTKD